MLVCIIRTTGETMKTLDDETTRILIVDDDPNICEILARYLRIEGYECLGTSDAERALELLTGGNFQLVISDIMMPGMSGIDLLGVIRRSWPDIAVLMVTAVDDRDTGVMASELGAIGYLIKPFSRNQLIISVASALKWRREKLLALRQQGLGKETQGTSVNVGQSKVLIDEAVELIKSGANDAELMEKLHLSSKGLNDLSDQLVSAGRIGRAEVDRRVALSPETVAVSITETKVVGIGGKKPTISAKDAVACIRSGMDDLALMKRYSISAKGLRSLLNKLLDSELLAPEEFYAFSEVRYDPILVNDIREFPRRFLAMSVLIYECERPEVKGLVRDITENGIGTIGIEMKVGETKRFAIPAKEFRVAYEIRFDAVCVWSENPGLGEQPLAGLQITKISEGSLGDLRQLIRSLALSE